MPAVTRTLLSSRVLAGMLQMVAYVLRACSFSPTRWKCDARRGALEVWRSPLSSESCNQNKLGPSLSYNNTFNYITKSNFQQYPQCNSINFNLINNNFKIILSYKRMTDQKVFAYHCRRSVSSAVAIRFQRTWNKCVKFLHSVFWTSPIRCNFLAPRLSFRVPDLVL
jgi:hypothetical protein